MKPNMHITNLADLRTLYGPSGGRSALKDLPYLDAHAARFITLSPFVVMASGQAQAPMLDASPRGGAPGFVKVADPHTLWLPDSPGNNRLDTLENIASHGVAGAPVGLLFVIPGVDETLRVNGRALLTTDEAVRQQCADERRVPKLVVQVTVEAAYLHCAKAFMRSRLWDAQAQLPRSALPSMTEMLRDQIREYRGEEVPAEPQEEMLARYRQTL